VWCRCNRTDHGGGVRRERADVPVYKRRLANPFKLLRMRE